MKTNSEEARQVFRQFAWHLAGKLARSQPARRPARPRPKGAR